MKRKRSVWKGAVAGLAAGFAGTVAMTAFQNAWNRTRQEKSAGEDEAAESATVKAARAIAENVLHRPLSESEKNRAGEMVHYGFGAMNGALYGAVAELSPVARKGMGLVFGGSLFVAADEILVPLLGWSGPPQDYPISSHLYGFASHLVYGVSSECARRVVRSALA